jgi:Mg-chelatase subunit ChlD
VRAAASAEEGGAGRAGRAAFFPLFQREKAKVVLMKIASRVLASALSAIALGGCASGVPLPERASGEEGPTLHVSSAVAPAAGAGRLALTAAVRSAAHGGALERDGVPLPELPHRVSTRLAGGEWREAKAVGDEGASPPIDLVFVSDNSGSQEGFLDEQVEALAKTAALVRGIDPANRIGLVRVSTGAKALAPLGPDAAAFERALDGLFVANGQTAFFDGVRLASEVLRDEGGAAPAAGSSCFPGAQKVIVAFTDGRENNSSAQLSAVDDDGVDTTLDDLRDLTAAADGRRPLVFTVGVGDKIAADDLRVIARSNGGFYLPIEGWDRLVDGLQAVVDFVASFRPICVEPAGPCDEARVTTTLPDGAVLERVTKVATPR